MKTRPVQHSRGAASVLAVACLLVVLPDTARAHSGGLDAQGCHTNRKTGEYHCHRAARPSNEDARPGAPGAATAPSSRPGIHFRNCAEARAAGAAPIRIGEPGYARHLDRDGDGVACEPYRERR